MNVAVSLVPDLRRKESHSPTAELAVVMDVLRATTVITTALAAGARDVVTCVDVEQAFLLARQADPRPLLCGERACRRIDGFDLGNSPAEYTSSSVAGRSLIMTTTNGTRAIAVAIEMRVPRIVLASFLNLSAVVDQIVASESVHLICAGTDGQITGEDVLLAGALIDRLECRATVKPLNDESRIAVHYWRAVSQSAVETSSHALSAHEEEKGGLKRRVAEEFSVTLGGRNLIAAGFGSDLHLCAHLDATRVVPASLAASPWRFTGARD